MKNSIDEIKKYLNEIKPGNKTSIKILNFEDEEFVCVLSDIELTEQIQKQIYNIFKKDLEIRNVDIVWKLRENV